MNASKWDPLFREAGLKRKKLQCAWLNAMAPRPAMSTGPFLSVLYVGHSEARGICFSQREEVSSTAISAVAGACDTALSKRPFVSYSIVQSHRPPATSVLSVDLWRPVQGCPMLT